MPDGTTGLAKLYPDQPPPEGQGRTKYRPKNKRKILCVFPDYAPSFGTFQHSYKLLPNVNGFMPPQGLLLIAAYLPESWEVKFVDENRRKATDEEFAWADAVFISGMHVQRGFINDINRRAHLHRKLTVLGGPSVSAAPEYYPEVDLLHIGELGDATDAVIAHIDRTLALPDRQVVYATGERVPLTEFPAPAYHYIDVGNYFLGSIQFSSGCPYLCEFCDIPALYGRNPRLKSPEQICRELDAILAAGGRSAVYFVDDNFVGNKKAAHDLLPHLIAWQKKNGYPLSFACEATLNMAQMPELLEMMREAAFHTVFVGIETPEEDALDAMQKKQNLRLPILEAVETFNKYGMEVVSGIIMGLDTDHEKTGETILKFVDASNIPLLTINLLYALPKTALYDRLQKDGRLWDDDEAAKRVSNVKFKMSYEDVTKMWFDTITAAYTPERLLRRYRYQCEHTFANRRRGTQKVSRKKFWFGVRSMARVLWNVGVKAYYRRAFWELVWPYIKDGKIDWAMHVAIVSHHLIKFTDEIRDGKWEACFYADPAQSAAALPNAKSRPRQFVTDSRGPCAPSSQAATAPSQGVAAL